MCIISVLNPDIARTTQNEESSRKDTVISASTLEQTSKLVNHIHFLKKNTKESYTVIQCLNHFAWNNLEMAQQ